MWHNRKSLCRAVHGWWHFAHRYSRRTRTSRVPAPSSTAHGTGSHTAEAFSYDDHTFAVLAEHFRFSAAVPGVPCVRITSDCKATSSFAKCVATCVKARKPHGPGAAHCRGKSFGAQSHRHSDARWAGPCSRCGQRAPTSTARAGPLWIKNVARPATAHPPRSPSLLDSFQLHSHRSGCAVRMHLCTSEAPSGAR